MTAVTVPVPPAHQRKCDAQAHALLQHLMQATPHESATWLSENVTTLVQAHAVLHALVLGLRHVYLKPPIS